MSGEPVLAHRIRQERHGKRFLSMDFTVYGGLHYIRGNEKPYFSLTYWQHRSGHPHQCESGGAGHDEIIRLYPKFADLAKMHLSDIDGVPMHPEANGWYWLAGACGGLAEQYHGANHSSYGDNSPENSLKVFADHVRISIEEAREIRDKVIEIVAYTQGIEPAFKAAREYWKGLVEGMRPRWKAEAEAVIANHHLKVYGDYWNPDKREG